jgi:ABC-type antimicrobial peptide transport system permease subunit
MGMYTQVLVKSRVPPLTLLHEVRRRIQQINPDQQTIKQVKDLNQWIQSRPEWAQERFVAMLFGAFSMIGLALSAVGLYSVVSYAVAQRTNEFGLRMAMGAQPTDVLHNVLRGTLTSVGFGIGSGLLLSALFSGVASQWLEGSSHNPLVLTGMVALLTLTCLVASIVPARRVSRTDPMVALRYE